MSPVLGGRPMGLGASGVGARSGAVQAGYRGPRSWAWLLRLLQLLLVLLAIVGLVGLAIKATPPALDMARRAVPLFGASEDHDGTQALGFAAPIGARRTTDFMIVCVVDVSGSMEENDPSDLRHRESVELARWLGRYGSAGDRMGVVQFATNVRSTGPFSPRLDQTQLEAALLDKRDLGTNLNPFGPAFQAAAEMFARAPEATPVLLFISDGVPDSLSFGSVVEDALATLPPNTRLHLLGMDSEGGFSKNRKRWESVIPVQSSTPIKSVSSQALAGPLAKVIEAETGQRVEVLGR